MNLPSKYLLLAVMFFCLTFAGTARADFEEHGTAVLQSLDKITARTATFEAPIGAALSYGQVFMKVMSCRKRPAIETPEAAAFLKVWEIKPGKNPQWIFSGWMFASSPALSGMDHPIYDVWLLDCKNNLSSSPEESSGAEPEAAG